MKTPFLHSIQIGTPKTIEDDLGTWETAFFKEPATGSVTTRFTGLEGDAQADSKNHGGREKAILVYSADHYPRWKAELGRELPYGGFAENLTVSGLDETTCCIGDILQISGTILQVTQARIPCWKISRRWGIPDLYDRVQRTGRFGWYCRVLENGQIEAGVPMHITDRPCPDWPVARAYQVYTKQSKNPTASLELAECRGLSKGWLRGIKQP